MEKEIMTPGQSGGDDLWIMNLKVIAVSPVYTGENKLEQLKIRKIGNRLPTRKSGDGFATVNISGVIRSLIEKIYKDEGTCDVGRSAKGCGRCLTCDMFGYLGKKGRILVDELKSVQPFDKVVSVAIHPKIDRESGVIPSERGASIEVEEIGEGTEFIGKIIIKNPKEKDLVALEAALKAAEETGIGGHTRRGKGRVRFEVNIDKKKWRTYKEIGANEAKKLVSKTGKDVLN